MTDEAGQTKNRKLEHINIVLTKETQYRKKTTMFEFVDLAPSKRKVDPSEVDIGTSLIGKRISAPLFVSGMTGGHPKALEINKDIAIAASDVGIPMGLGSQRAMIEDKSLTYTYDVKKFAPDLILIGNIGASKLTTYSTKVIQEMLDSVKADILAVHTNPGQESVQPEGDISFIGVLERITEAAATIKQPLIVKEVGNGISKEVAAMLDGKVYGIDIQGAGGTTWIGIELYRSREDHRSVLWDWGMPTALSLIESKSAFHGPVWASGGIRDAKQVAKALALGADMCGMAQPVIASQARGGISGVTTYLNGMIGDLKKEMAGLGVRSIPELRKLDISFRDPLADILKQRGIKR
jgi:isopentenyl-diphosphate Delta-isomerase